MKQHVRIRAKALFTVYSPKILVTSGMNPAMAMNKTVCQEDNRNLSRLANGLRRFCRQP